MIETVAYDLAHEGDVGGVREWLEKNSEHLNRPVSDGYTLLHVACMFGHEPLVRYLIGAGALVNVDADNASRATPLHLAASFRDEKIAESICRYLVDHGAELNSMQKGGQTPLHHAVARGSVNLVNMLVEAGADPFLEDENGLSASDLANPKSSEMPAAPNGEAIRASLKKAFSLPLESR